MRDSGRSAGDSSIGVARAPAKDARKTILFVGTSLTAGYGIDPQQSYPALIQRRLDSLGLNYEAVNAGVSGETSSGAVHRMPWLLKQPFDVFVLETGANDGLRGLPIDSLRANIQHILDDGEAHPPAGEDPVDRDGGVAEHGAQLRHGLSERLCGPREEERRDAVCRSCSGVLPGWTR